MSIEARSKGGWGDEPILNVWLSGAEVHVTSFDITPAALQAVTRTTDHNGYKYETLQV